MIDYNFEYDSKVDIKQDIETYIDWDVDTKITVDLEKDIDVDVNVDIDVKDNGSDIFATVKDIDPYGEVYDPVVIGSTQAVEDALSTADLLILTDNVTVDLSSSALDKTAAGLYDGGKLDSATYTEINIGVDHVVGQHSIITLNMEAYVDG